MALVFRHRERSITAGVLLQPEVSKISTVRPGEYDCFHSDCGSSVVYWV